MLNDLFGWFKRNMYKMNEYQLKKDLEQVNKIKVMLERRLKEMEGVA